jgi:hypothetical protein
MSALLRARDARKRGGEFQTDVVKNDEVIYRGAAVCLDSNGEAVNATAATGLISRGVARDTVDNSADGETIDSDEGVFEFFNKSGDELSQDEIGDVCYWEDNQTVCKTSTGKSVAGVVKSVDAGTGKVSVLLGPWPVQIGLLAANDLSDVGSAATARANILANKLFLTFDKVSSKASDAEVARFVIPFACVISKFYTILNAALATADATVQAKKNGSNIGSTTTGLATVTEAASAAGDVDSATPLTTNLSLAAGDILSFTVGGGSTATATLNISAVLTY